MTPEQEHTRKALKLAGQVLADRLGETRRDARDAIARLVQVYGLQFASEHFERTLEVEGAGGLLKSDGERRTLGGVFFFLVKQTLGLESFRAVVPAQWKVAKDRRAAEKERAARAAAKIAPPVGATEP